MTDPRVQALARLLVNYCVAVQPGDRIFINSSFSAQPLAAETYREVLRAGGHPLPHWHDEQFKELLLKEGSEAQISYIHEPVRHIYDEYDALISLRGATNTRALSGVDPQRQQWRAAASHSLLQTMMRRTAADDFRWVGTLFPTAAQAQEADMSLGDFEDFVYRACFVDQPDPEACWREISARQQRLVDWLRGKEQVRVSGPDVDLTLSIASRTFVNSDGHRNMPSGEIFTGPVEDAANGWVRFTYPAIYAGREVEGIELRFEDGRVVEASAGKNESFLQAVLDTDPGARYLGEFAIGTNDGIDRFTKSILFDEKIGGTIHLAVGAGYPETGSENESAVHWDMICDMRDGGRIWVDDELFYDSGKFTVLQEPLLAEHA
jgi:aminopeptidase